jgi:hypothetical protein
MPAAINPIKRVWKPKASAALQERLQLDVYGNEIYAPDVREKNTDSIWDTFEALQAAKAETAAKATHE